MATALSRSILRGPWCPGRGNAPVGVGVERHRVLELAGLVLHQNRPLRPAMRGHVEAEEPRRGFHGVCADAALLQAATRATKDQHAAEPTRRGAKRRPWHDHNAEVEETGPLGTRVVLYRRQTVYGRLC